MSHPANLLLDPCYIRGPRFPDFSGHRGVGGDKVSLHG
jgi:hypothetical protein